MCVGVTGWGAGAEILHFIVEYEKRVLGVRLSVADMNGELRLLGGRIEFLRGAEDVGKAAAGGRKKIWWATRLCRFAR